MLTGPVRRNAPYWVRWFGLPRQLRPNPDSRPKVGRLQGEQAAVFGHPSTPCPFLRLMISMIRQATHAMSNTGAAAMAVNRSVNPA